MSDPLGLIRSISSPNPGAIGAPKRQDGPIGGPDFKEMLQQQIDEVNKLQNDANVAIEDLAAGRRDDLESVITATQKADLAFRMLLQVRNKVMDAYEEVKQIRV